MLWRAEDSLESNLFESGIERTAVVVAGPGSSLTIPGVIVSELVQALARLTHVTRIEVDLNSEFLTGLHRARSLSAAHDDLEGVVVLTHRALPNNRLRAQSFRDLIGPNVGTVVAYAWPGIDNSWIKQFVQAGRSAGALTVVACASLPQPSHARAVSLVGTLLGADVVLVGDKLQAKELAAAFGRTGPVVEALPGLSLSGRGKRPAKQQITTFLPKDDAASLATLLAAFDAIPEAWIDAYNLQVVMRFEDSTVPDLVANSYHSDHVELVGENFSALDLQELCASSSALGIADPSIDSRAFSMAVKCGIGTVVLGSARLPEVGRGYVGGLLANGNRIASVHVALIHALRLAELQFPSPESMERLAVRIVGARRMQSSEIRSKIGVS